MIRHFLAFAVIQSAEIRPPKFNCGVLLYTDCYVSRMIVYIFINNAINFYFFFLLFFFLLPRISSASSLQWWYRVSLAVKFGSSFNRLIGMSPMSRFLPQASNISLRQDFTVPLSQILPVAHVFYQFFFSNLFPKKLFYKLLFY